MASQCAYSPAHVYRSSMRANLSCREATMLTDASIFERPRSGGTNRSPRKKGADRFIPASHSLSAPVLGSEAQALAEACGARATRILEYRAPAPQSMLPADLRAQYLTQKPARVKPARKISSVPERILDAPGILDDYYLNLLDWSQQNKVAIGLENSVYVWNASTGDVSAAAELPDGDYVSSVKWSNDGYLAIGSSTGDIQIWDVEAEKRLRTMRGRISRVSSLAWNQHILSSGARDGNIWHHDVRIAQHKSAELSNHTGEVCGLTWRADGSQLASGGNDNIVNIWDARTTSVPRHSKTNHTAAVKALAWCPWQTSLLATGGGSLDRQIHLWNTTTGARMNSIDTGSQVTALRWNPHGRELASCHGYPTNYLSVWSYPSLSRVADVEAHDTRILHAALSPDGEMLATCATDENLKFWRLFSAPPPPPLMSNTPKMMVLR